MNACPIPGLWLGLVGRASSVAPAGTPPSVGVIVPSIIPAFVAEAVAADECTASRYLLGVLVRPSLVRPIRRRRNHCSFTVAIMPFCFYLLVIVPSLTN